MSLVRHGQDLVATCWTSAGNARPADPDPRSPIPVMERLAAVAAAGFTGMGLIREDLRALRDDLGFAALRERADAVGIPHLEVELVEGWWGGAEETDWRADWELLLEAARALRSPLIKIAPPPGGPVEDLTPLLDPLRRLAEEAADSGTRIALEPLPFAAIESLPRGAELMAAVDHEGAGLVVDCWHVFRAGTSLPELAATLDPRTVFAVEINDARDAVPEGVTLFEDTRDNRCYPGEGEQEVVGFLRTLLDLGFAGPWGVEILSEQHRAAPLDEALAHAVRTTRQCFDQIDAHRIP